MKTVATTESKNKIKKAVATIESKKKEKLTGYVPLVRPTAFQLCDTSLKKGSACDPILGMPRASPCVLQASLKNQEVE